MPAATRVKPRPRGRPPSPPDPALADRVRSLRIARGLTQAELAGSEFSKGFISLLETGRTGMSVRAAGILAARLGVSVDDLMRPSRVASDREVELALVRAEAELATGRPEEALRTAAPAARAKRELRARYLRLKGRVLTASGKPREAVGALDEALRLFREGAQRELAARTLFDLAQASARAEALGEAVHYALECENSIAAGDVVDATLELRVLTFLANAFITLGDLASAELRMDRAISLAQDVADSRAVGNMYLGLSVVRERAGDLEAALLYARKGLELYERMGVGKHVGNAWNTLGWLYTERKQFGKARESLATAQRVADETEDGRLEAYVLQSKAELALAEGKADEAVELATRSASHPQASRRCRALSLLVRAQALARTDAKVPAVTAAFEEAIKALEPHGRLLVARAQRGLFESLVARGRLAEAAEAARGAFAALEPAVL